MSKNTLHVLLIGTLFALGAAFDPVPMHDYSPWIKFDGGISYRYRVN